MKRKIVYEESAAENYRTKAPMRKETRHLLSFLVALPAIAATVIGLVAITLYPEGAAINGQDKDGAFQNLLALAAFAILWVITGLTVRALNPRR